MMHKVITLRSYKYARNFDMSDLLHQLQIIEIDVFLERVLKEEEKRTQKQLWNA